jgi:hypothetical protein
MGERSGSPLLRFVVDHESLRGLRALHGSLDEASRPVLLRATSSMPHQLLGDDPMARLSFVRFRDLAEQAVAAGKLDRFADAVAAASRVEPEGNPSCPPAESPFSATSSILARFTGNAAEEAAGPFPLRKWGDALEEACAGFGVEPRVRVFVGAQEGALE